MSDPRGGGNTGGVTPERLPIKLIMPDQGVSRPVRGGGGPQEPFRAVDAEFRASLNTQVLAIEHALSPQMQSLGAAPVRVQLLQRALAKSHRPEQLFSDQTCPIIGAGKLGELYVKATPAGLRALSREISNASSVRMIKELSTVQSIEAVTPAVRRRQRTPQQLLADSPRVDRDEFVTRVRLFDFGNSYQQERATEEFYARCRQRSLAVDGKGYSALSQVYAVRCRNVADIEALSAIVSIRSLTAMPIVRMIRSQALNAAALPPDLPTSADVEGDYPIVVVVDSGVSENVPMLRGWTDGRISNVAPSYRNAAHGTFVAGLIVWGDRLNPHLADVSTQPCGVFDLQVFPNDDPAHGDTESLTEQELLQALDEALQEHANKYKVCNLSLSSSEVCAEDEFSAFAEQLDNLQETYQVSFVIAAGNYETRPMLDYPRQGAQLAEGRITAPADTVLGITVGSISHLEYTTPGGPRREEPSPFSRHGAGPNHIIKPDLTHYGGTCTPDFQHISGVRSLTEGGTGEDIGTSFATPIVSRSLAHIYHQITPTPSPVLARALLIHHARDPRDGGRIPSGDEDYFGFGRPVPPPYCLECKPHQSTLVFEDVLRPGFFLEWDDFPYPPSLKRGSAYFGDVSFTIAFAPSRGSRWGTEYCETHIDAHFGVYQTVKPKGGGTTERFKGLVPPEHSNPGQLYEDVQIKELRKWAPVRTYYGDLSKGVRGNRWRLMVRLLTRHGVEDHEASQSQPFALIVTIADPDQRAPIYDEMAQLIHSRYKSANLAVRASARVRPHS